MAGEWLFWGIAAAVAVACLGLVFAPLLRGSARSERRASYDLQVHRDQLREVEADLARGLLSPEEARATGIEISRRLLASADAEAGEVAAGAAPPRVSRAAAGGAAVALIAAAFGLYGWLGGGARPDAPLAPRLAEAAAERATRPSQAEAEAAAAAQAKGAAPPAVAASAQDLELIARLQAAMKQRPDDLQGQRLLAQSLAALGNWVPARAAQAQVVDLLGDKATARDLVDLAELSILAAGGYVSPEAEKALSRALVQTRTTRSGGTIRADADAGRPARPRLPHLVGAGRRGSAGRALDGGGEGRRCRGGAAGWDRPRRRRGGRARTPTPPTSMRRRRCRPDQRQAMIEGMVAQLSDRLATQGGPPADWAQLIRSLGVLGRSDEAAAILTEARQKHADDRDRAGADRGGRARRGADAVSVFEEAAGFAAALPGAGALMGLDLGTKTIGVAVSDTSRRIASPLETVRRTKFAADAAALLKLAGPRRIAGIVLGLPRNMDGSEGPRAQSTRAFARNLAGLTELPIAFWDERLSTVAAERALLEADASRRRRAEVIDHVAAGYILQGLLDRLGHLEREAR